MLNHDISFKDYKRSNDIHGTVLYPAVMVAPVQKQVLVDIINKNQFIKLIDPFHVRHCIIRGSTVNKQYSYIWM